MLLDDIAVEADLAGLEVRYDFLSGLVVKSAMWITLYLRPGTDLCHLSRACELGLLWCPCPGRLNHCPEHEASGSDSQQREPSTALVVI